MSMSQFTVAHSVEFANRLYIWQTKSTSLSCGYEMFMEIFRPDQYQLKYVVLACESEQHESYFGVEWSPIQNAQEPRLLKPFD